MKLPRWLVKPWSALLFWQPVQPCSRCRRLHTRATGWGYYTVDEGERMIAMGSLCAGYGCESGVKIVTEGGVELVASKVTWYVTVPK